TTGTQADPLTGAFEIPGLAAGNYTVEVSLLGYVTQSLPVSLTAGQTATLDVQLEESVLDVGGEVTVVGNKVVKREDFPMPMETINVEELLSDVTTNTSGILRKKSGVDMQCTGVDRCETVLRGFNNAFSGSAYVLTDYRQAAVASLGVNILSIAPALTLDVDRIEVVRGPASALYGAGVDAGVVHFFSKDPLAHPGTSISVTGGERSYFSVEARHANRVSDRFGYKITGLYGQADDWELDVNNPADSIFVAQDCAAATDPAACFAAGGARNTDFDKINANATLQFKVGGASELVATGGFSQLNSTILSGIGTLQAVDYRYTYGQVRFQTRDDKQGFFAQAYVNRNDAGESFVYSGPVVIDNSALYNLQAQYDRTFGPHSVVAGVDVELTRPDTDGRINGRNEDNDNTDELGAYAQGQYELSRRFALTGALRGDYDSISEEFQVSPRVAATIKVGPQNREGTHTVRSSFNIAFSSPGTNSNFLDIIAGQVPGTDITVRGRGSAFGHEWRRNAQYATFAPTDLVATSLLPMSLGQETAQGVFLPEMYGLVHAGIAAIPAEALAAQLNGALGLPQGSITAQTAAFLVDQLSPANTSVDGFVPGLLGILNTSTGELDFVTDLTDIKPLGKTTTTTVELGYTGVFENVGKGLVINIDAYYANKKDFVGPLLMETPFVVAPGLADGLETALATGIANNPVLTGALGQLGVTPAVAAGLVVALSEDSLPSAVAIVEASSNAASPGSTPELMLAYRNFGKIDYAGVDVSFELQASKALSLFGNASYVSDDFFDNEELDETGTDLS
ncbi:MAG: TonB-dependent receptor, partial [Rhodothermales bacterium]|nr:TonB-dependent receptor [Rhodothermales bacterium]